MERYFLICYLHIWMTYLVDGTECVGLHCVCVHPTNTPSVVFTRSVDGCQLVDILPSEFNKLFPVA